jgi:propanediol dehydratase small subunit
MYDSLRPVPLEQGRSCTDLADELEQKYNCTINAAFIRQAADVYEMRGRLKKPTEPS